MDKPPQKGGKIKNASQDKGTRTREREDGTKTGRVDPEKRSGKRHPP